jgi:hypothetical protein
MPSIAELVDRVHERIDPTNRELVAIEHGMELEPRNPVPVYTLAQLCRRSGSIDLWRAALDVAFALPHLTYEQVFQRAPAKLTLGNWSGWIDHEARIFNPQLEYFQSKRVRHLRWAKRAWDGREELNNRTVFVLADGGFADCIQMLRYVPELLKIAQHVILGVRPELVTLVKHNFEPSASVVFRDFEHPLPFDRYTWGMSLPALFGKLPPFSSLATPRRRDINRTGDGRRRVGLCWSGTHPSHEGLQRLLPLATLRTLLSQTNVQWCSLQAGEPAADSAGCAGILQPTSPLLTFADAASEMGTLDLVVTVDTAVAHLAGSLGIPTLVMLEFASEFHWGLAATTPWYPSMRLVRQRVPGDWSSVVADVMLALDGEQRSPMPADLRC